MQHRIENLPEKKLIGQHHCMSFLNNRTLELWQNFMPRRNEIKNNIGTERYSAEVYPPQFFTNYDPANEFEKWAAIEVTDLTNIPVGMKSLIFPEGLYAVFVHKGLASEGTKTYRYIFTSWLPQSVEYLLDNRPHFAVMGEKYKPNDANSEEEIWIPVKLQTNKL